MFIDAEDVSIEFMSFQLRIGDGHKFGKGFSATCRIDKCDVDAVRITGLHGVVTSRQYVSLKNALFKLGYNSIYWERFREDGTKEELVYHKRG